MKSILRAMGATTALAGLVLLVNLTLAQDTKGPPSPDALLKALAVAGQPGPEHKKLEPFVGDWNLTVKLWVDPSQPPVQTTGTVESKWILGGRFVQSAVKIECQGKTFEGLALLGYDSMQKKFTAAKVCGLTGTISQGFATCNASGTKFECTDEACCPLTGQKFMARKEISVESNNRIVVNMFATKENRELKMAEIVFARR